VTVEPRAALETAYHAEKRRVLATLIRLLGGFDAAEEALHEAFAAAAVSWPRDGVPDNPYAWLVSAGRFKTIDRVRRQARLDRALPELLRELPADAPPIEPGEAIDDELRLMFMCCHPALPPDARVALTLRELGGLTTEEIARAFLARPPAIAQRIVRAKAKIHGDRLPYELPRRAELPERLESVLRVIYLIFNEGYVATGGPSLLRADLCRAALRLGRLAVGLLEDPEAQGLLALMLLHESRRAARLDVAGDLVLLEDQDRALWDRGCIDEAQALIARGFATRRVGPHLLQAAIAAVHAEAPSLRETDWSRIVALYDVLLRLEPSPVVALNRAVALGERDGAAVGLAALEAASAAGALDTYHLAHAARAELLRRLGRTEAAQVAYQRALALTAQPAEQRFLARRLERLASDASDS
jgi:RNA polymerase sigma-70 factor (ECF subfamily)